MMVTMITTIYYEKYIFLIIISMKMIQIMMAYLYKIIIMMVYLDKDIKP